MRITELAEYAKEAYGIEHTEECARVPCRCVLRDPRTGRRVASLIRERDGRTGREIERCTIRCGRPSALLCEKPYVTHPIPGYDIDWAAVEFTDETERSVVVRLFDRAMALCGDMYTVVLDTLRGAQGASSSDTPLPYFGRASGMPAPTVPERIAQMRRLYVYGSESLESRAENFRRQAAFMKDYEDEYPWPGEWTRAYPTYHDLTTRQLRGYFSWRTRARKGEFLPISPSAAYIYVFELLNGIGAGTPSDALEKLLAFERGYVDKGYGDVWMRDRLHSWMLALSVVNGLPQEEAREFAGRELTEQDLAVEALRTAQEQTDEAVYLALARFGGAALARSPVPAKDMQRCARLFASAWRHAAAEYEKGGRDLFTLCFSEPSFRPWYPFTDAVYRGGEDRRDRVYELDPVRTYRCSGGRWEVSSYERLYFDTKLLKSFLREADRVFRLYLKTGRPLKPDREASWATPFARKACEEDTLYLIELSRPRVTIDVSLLDGIRQDALVTQSSLLVPEEEELALPGTAVPEAAVDPASAPRAPDATGTCLALEPAYEAILRELLRGGDAAGTASSLHVMPSIAADAINDALYGAIGDTAVECDGNSLCLVPDYADDVARILGGEE